MDLLKKFTKRDRNLSVGSSGYIAGEIPQISHLQIVQEDIAQPDDAKVNEMFESLLVIFIVIGRTRWALKIPKDQQ